MIRANALTAVALAAVAAAGLSLAHADAPAPGGALTKDAKSTDMGAQLIQGLLQTPGCLGVDAGQMRSGKNSIFAWFENKAAVERWYYSDVHQRMMHAAVPPDPNAEPSKPLEYVTDENVPIMVIASITFADKPMFKEMKLPISQISIELFTALPGGAALGGRLSPPAFKVPHMQLIDEPTAPDASAAD